MKTGFLKKIKANCIEVTGFLYSSWLPKAADGPQDDHSNRWAQSHSYIVCVRRVANLIDRLKASDSP